MKNLDSTGLKRLHRQWRRQTESDVAILLDSVQTPFNVGTILRTAAAYRSSHIWFSGATPLPSHPKVARTALGTDRYLTWSFCEEIEEAITQIKDSGFSLLGIELSEDAMPIFQAPIKEKTCLVFGHEDRGLSSQALEACDSVAFIPQLGRVGSLNVATAAGIAIYETHRRIWSP